MVGLLPIYRADSSNVVLRKGDRLAVYSDGIPDAPTVQGEFGDEGLIRLLQNEPTSTAAQLTERVAAAALSPQFDDMTLLLARGL